jgi:lipoate-protein ligase A
MYTLILSCDYDPALGSIEGAHRWVLQRLAAALTTSDAPVLRAGTSDLVVELPSGIRKFSGNSLRLKQSVVMYHGTVLYDFPLELIGAYLHQPPREPTYREGRAHQNFVGNLPLSRCEIRAALIGAFDATGPAAPPPGPLVAQLVAEKYTRDHWNLRH